MATRLARTAWFARRTGPKNDIRVRLDWNRDRERHSSHTAFDDPNRATIHFNVRSTSGLISPFHYIMGPIFHSWEQATNDLRRRIWRSSQSGASLGVYKWRSFVSTFVVVTRSAQHFLAESATLSRCLFWSIYEMAVGCNWRQHSGTENWIFRGRRP